MKKCLQLAALACVLGSGLAAPGLAKAGLVWGELGAGDVLATAETTYSSAYSMLDGIHGNLLATTVVDGTPVYQVDLYKIRITDAASFSARTTGSTAFDSALYLFDANGNGVYMNDDDGVSTLSGLPAGDASGPTSAGIYYLAVALGGYLAEDFSSLSVFLAGGFTDVLGADPAAGALNGWAAGFTAYSESSLSYDIALTGATNAELPEPASLALVLAGGLAAGLSRRRAQGARATPVAA